MPPQRHLPPSTQPRVRQRSARACGPCRRRKIKCDGTEPCAACAVYGYDCVFNDTPRRKPAAKSPDRPVATTEVANPILPGTAITLGEPLKNNELFIASESILEPSNTDPLLLRALKTRFTTIHSAIAVPRKLGMTLGLQPLPRLQSFGWNPGIRPEPHVTPKIGLCDIISVDQMRYYSDIYFNEVHPYFGILDKDLYTMRSKEFWLVGRKGIDFEACICGVVALGSYFSSEPLSTEAEVVEQGRYLLDFSIAHAPAQLSIKHVLAWILRAIYLRSTTRPHLSWLASCNAMHLAEAIGLHREISESQVPCERLGNHRPVEPLEVDLRRRTFWVAVALNQLLCSEYGRTKITIDMISCKPLQPVPGDFTLDVVNIMTSVPRSQDFTTANIAELVDSLRMACEMPAKSAFLGLLKADACFCIYRMLRCTNIILPSCRVTPLLEVIRVALDGVKFLCSMRQAWWNLIGTPFHCVCVLLALGTPASLEMVPKTLETLKAATDLYNSHLSDETLRTAYALVQGARDKRKQEIENLDRGLENVGELPSATNGELDSVGFFESPMNGDMGGFMDFVDIVNFYGPEVDAFMLT
ncbi:uncharacterized protein LY89DRAFT_477705 [Mollisia scopiformis]|uniref:Zn(2)-C6 fungal-type domain-containing protein n=1 Tax=Mollisia scopiformis TaxID=149040 RepID=A0A194XH68_MOLSC|nr:uncharacterized protein LY89DRAFT_477705 [Mollisia scopiformis]KUJ19117.1 hypothetical protein LY89DRAFT_477705 [Mollisia scopiformis]